MINDFLSILLKFRHFALAGLCLVLATQAVAAADARTPDVIGTYGNWNALSFTDNGGGKVCFMASLPKQQIGVSGKKRGKVQFFITHWAADKTRNTVSVSAGYAYKSGSKVTVSVDGKSYTLLTDGETALLCPGGPNPCTEDLRDAVLKLARDPDLRQRLGRAARERLLERGYLWEENARRVEELVARSREKQGAVVAMGEVRSC